MDYLGYGSSGIDLLVSGAQFTVGAIKNSGQHKAAYETSKFLKNNLNIKVRPGDLRRGTKQFLGNASKKVAVIGGVLAVGDVLIDGNIRASHLLNMGMVVVTAIPVAGWIIGGAYFVGDLATMGITGKSIGDHLDSAVGGPLVDNIYDWD